jgi:hypothetical protein
MATWFTVIGCVAQIENILDSNYKNALVEFEEGDPADKQFSLYRSFYIMFWGDLFDSGPTIRKHTRDYLWGPYAIPDNDMFPSAFCCFNHCNSPHVPHKFVPIRSDCRLCHCSKTSEPHLLLLLCFLPEFTNSRSAV